MLKIKSSFSFLDKTSATAEINAIAPEDNCIISYDGNYGILKERFEGCNAMSFEAFCQNIAKENNAELKIEKTGHYDEWAE